MKKQETPYESNGNISVKYNLGDNIGVLEEDIKKLDNVSISYTGKTDVKNNYNYRKVNLNYSEEEAMIINYIHSNDFFGVKVDGVLKKYLSIENNNLKEFVGKFGVDTEDIPDHIDIESIQSLLNGKTEIFTEEELEQIKNNYLTIILNNLNDELFTQSETAQGKKITLTLDQETLKNIYIDIITKLKDDELILGRLKEKAIELAMISEEEADEFISTLKEALEESIKQNPDIENDETEGQDTEIYGEFDSVTSEEEEVNVVISFYIENKEVVKTEVTDSDFKITMTKTENGFNIETQEVNLESEEYETIGNITINNIKEEDSLNYEIIIDANEIVLTYNINYTGINTLTEVDSSINMNFEYHESEEETNSVYGLSYMIANKTIFKDSINTEFDLEKDAMVVNEYEPKQLESLFNKLTPALIKLNETKMNKTGFKTFPFIYYSPSAVLSMSILNSAKQSIETTDLSEQVIESFNMRFTPYEGNDISGSRVKALISAVQSNNMTEADGGHIIQSLIINGISYDITDGDIESQIIANKTYTVKMDKDSEGYIYLIDIEENAF